MNLTLNNFNTKEWYGFYNDESGYFKAFVAGKERIELENQEEEFLLIYVPPHKDLFTLKLKDILYYYHIKENDDGLVEARLFNPELEKYDIQLGDTMTVALKKIIETWNEYNDEEKAFICSELLGAMTSQKLIDLITVLVDTKEECEHANHRILSMLKQQEQFYEEYEEFKAISPKFCGSIMDIFLFDMLGLPRPLKSGVIYDKDIDCDEDIGDDEDIEDDEDDEDI